MTWIEKLVTPESLEAAIARVGSPQELKAALAEMNQLGDALESSVEWRNFVAAHRVLLQIRGMRAVETIALDAFLCGAKAARRVAEVETFEGMVRE
jgi:hypothetical protein